LATGNLLEPPTLEERIAVCESHLDFSIRWKGNHGGIVEMRRHYSNYFRGMDHFKPFRTKLVTSYSLDEIKETLQEITHHYA
jgi:tRNA-dihydrouridine synthase